jgi:hypothetical protein
VTRPAAAHSIMTRMILQLEVTEFKLATEPLKPDGLRAGPVQVTSSSCPGRQSVIIESSLSHVTRLGASDDGLRLGLMAGAGPRPGALTSRDKLASHCQSRRGTGKLPVLPGGESLVSLAERPARRRGDRDHSNSLAGDSETGPQLCLCRATPRGAVGLAGGARNLNL